jgi:catechol-2,3-dioxygenase
MTRSIDPKTLMLPAKFAHVVLRVRDVAASAAWYRQVVGMKEVFGNDFVQFMTYDDEHHRIALIKTPVEELAPRGSAGLDHIAYGFDNLGQLLSTYRRLEGLGIKPVWAINHGPTTSFYYEDPDANRVEFQVDNFRTEAELKGWMESGAFAKNPIGVEFDAEKLVARYERGDPIEELVQQGSA